MGSGVKYQAGEILVTSLEKRLTSNQEKQILKMSNYIQFFKIKYVN